MPELIKEDLVRTGKELYLITLDQLKVVNDQVLQIHWIRVFKEASITFGKLEDVLLIKLKTILFACFKVEDDYDEGVRVNQGAHQVNDKVNSVDLTTLLAHQVAITNFVGGSKSRVPHVNVQIGGEQIVEQT